MKPALLVVDIQNVWLESKELKESVERHLDAINEAIAWFRKSKRPIIVIYHENRELGALRGTRRFEFLESVMIRDTDTKITKRYPNSFCKTDLEAILRKEGCDTVVITGSSASWCVLGTFFGAIDCDLHPYVLQGGVAAQKEEHVRFAEEICDTMSLSALEKAVR
jgi:nicotinamidase-related amidase